MSEYSKKKDDDESYLPTEKLLNLIPGLNEFTINQLDFQIPEWWIDEYQNPDITFDWNDLRSFELSAEFRGEKKSISDTLRIYNVEFVQN